MDRNMFIKKSCLGICMGSLFLLDSAKANTMSAKIISDNQVEEDWRVGFMHKWISDLISSADNNLDPQLQKQLLEYCGRQCAKTNAAAEIEKFKGNLNGLMEELRQKWVEQVDFDAEKGKFYLKGKKSESCACAIINGNKNKVSGTFCNCSLGFYKELFESVGGKPISIKLTETLLRGSDRCSVMAEY
jgi:hypothetical protein